MDDTLLSPQAQAERPRGPSVPTTPIAVGVFYRRRCEVTRLKLTLWHDRRVWFDGWVVTSIEPDDPITDKEPTGYILALQRRWRGAYEYEDRPVDAGSLIDVATGHPGLRPIL